MNEVRGGSQPAAKLGSVLVVTPTCHPTLSIKGATGYLPTRFQPSLRLQHPAGSSVRIASLVRSLSLSNQMQWLRVAEMQYSLEEHLL